MTAECDEERASQTNPKLLTSPATTEKGGVVVWIGCGESTVQFVCPFWPRVPHTCQYGVFKSRIVEFQCQRKGKHGMHRTLLSWQYEECDPMPPNGSVKVLKAEGKIQLCQKSKSQNQDAVLQVCLSNQGYFWHLSKLQTHKGEMVKQLWSHLGKWNPKSVRHWLLWVECCKVLCVLKGPSQGISG